MNGVTQRASIDSAMIASDHTVQMRADAVLAFYIVAGLALAEYLFARSGIAELQTRTA